MDQAVKDAFATLTQTVERGFSAAAEDMAALSTQVASIENELQAIRRELDDLANTVDNIAGFRKEIDHALARIAAIEKHLGITRKIAA